MMSDRCSCGNPIARPAHRRKTRFCKSCAIKALCSSPEHRAKLSAGQQRRWARPEERRKHGERIAAGVRKALEDPKALAAARSRGRSVGRTNAGRKIRPDIVSFRAEAIANTRLAWCPAEWRNDYRQLLYARNTRAAQARAIIEEQIAAGETPRHLGPRLKRYQRRQHAGQDSGWCPPQYLIRLAQLLEETSMGDARRILTEEIIEAGDALELQLHRLRRGATLTEERGPIVRAAEDRTYGGVAAYAC